MSIISFSKQKQIEKSCRRGEKKRKENKRQDKTRQEKVEKERKKKREKEQREKEHVILRWLSPLPSRRFLQPGAQYLKKDKIKVMNMTEAGSVEFTKHAQQ